MTERIEMLKTTFEKLGVDFAVISETEIVLFCPSMYCAANDFVGKSNALIPEGIEKYSFANADETCIHIEDDGWGLSWTIELDPYTVEDDE